MNGCREQFCSPETTALCLQWATRAPRFRVGRVGAVLPHRALGGSLKIAAAVRRARYTFDTIEDLHRALVDFAHHCNKKGLSPGMDTAL